MLALTPDQLAFVTERHLATLSTLRPDGSPHVVPVGFTWDPERGRVRVTTKVTSVKARHISGADGPVRAAVCQLDGRRWLTLEGEITLSRDAAEIAEAVEAYAVRYRPRPFQPERVVLHLAVDRVLGSVR